MSYLDNIGNVIGQRPLLNDIHQKWFDGQSVANGFNTPQSYTAQGAARAVLEYYGNLILVE